MSWYVRRPLSREQSISPSFTHYRRLQEIRAAIPSHLFIRETRRGLAWLALDIAMAGCCWRIASFIDPTFTSHAAIQILSSPGATFACWTSWMLYWWFQGLIFTGIWVIGHECGHGAFSPNQRLCNVIGFITHSLLWTPYLSWKISHHRHHCNHASMERDEVYVPKTRSELGIPEDDGLTKIDYEEYFGDTPIYTLFMLVRQQLLAFPAYLLFNVSGQKTYPRWTNHFDPNSVLFTKEQRNAVLLSNFGIIAVAALVRQACKTWGVGTVIKYYGVPWLCVTHWYVHHDHVPAPHRSRVAALSPGGVELPARRAATVDRNFLGWMGRFFLHDVAHYHVVHHFFPKMPFYHGAEATKHLRAFLGEHYHYSEKPVFKALWDNYNDCQFVEDRGDVLFYRDRKGRAVIRPAARYQICAAESSS
ncbi:linoleoyl phosphatidylcholine delta-12 acetylenase [Trametes gibbosa]|nr:linoleoyl phosphatidylcholine delta-12 acetylenase [Trametes gibbosa]